MGLGGVQSELLQRMMSAATRRAEVLSANLANANTPGYVRQVLRFEELLASELERGGDARSLLAVEPEVRPDTLTPGTPDGNNVTLELELGALRENRVLYETYAAILEGRGRILRSAVTGGGA